LIETEPEKLVELFPSLAPDEQLGLLLFSPGELRQELLRTTPIAEQLVSLLPVQEAHLTLREIGLPDATFFLSLLTREQLQYVSDLETWKKDLFNPPDFVKYLEIIKQCGEGRLSEWLCTLDPETLVLVLKAYGEVTKVDIFKDEVEEATTRPYISFDGYYRFHPIGTESLSFFETALRLIHSHSPSRYGMIMESAYQDMTAEVEEQAKQFRNGRLCDRGIPVFDEAMEIYRPLKDEQVTRFGADSPPVHRGTTDASPLYPVRWLPADSFLRETLLALSNRPETDGIRLELASLANKVLVADGLEVKNPEVLKHALRKASGFLTIGLESLSGRDVKRSADWMMRTWILLLFRLGYTHIHRLVRRATRLRDRSGFRWIDRYQCLADTPYEETLRGLFMTRPMFFDGVTESNWLGFREFNDLRDVHVTSDRLDAVEALSGIFQDLNLPPETIKDTCLEGGFGDLMDTVKWSKVLHTLWVQRTLTGRTAFTPLSLPEVTQFLRSSFLSEPEGSSRKLEPGYTQELIHWVSGHVPDPDHTLREHLKRWILEGTDQMEQELGALSPDLPPDPRAISCLCLSVLPVSP